MVSTSSVESLPMLEERNLSFRPMTPDSPHPACTTLREFLPSSCYRLLSRALSCHDLYYVEQFLDPRCEKVLPWHELRMQCRRAPFRPPSWYATILEAIRDNSANY